MASTTPTASAFPVTAAGTETPAYPLGSVTRTRATAWAASTTLRDRTANTAWKASQGTRSPGTALLQVRACSSKTSSDFWLQLGIIYWYTFSFALLHLYLTFFFITFIHIIFSSSVKAVSLKPSFVSTLQNWRKVKWTSRERLKLISQVNSFSWTHWVAFLCIWCSCSCDSLLKLQRIKCITLMLFSLTLLTVWTGRTWTFDINIFKKLF